MVDQHVLKLFKAMVTDGVGNLDLSNVASGFITNFRPTPKQLKLLQEEFKPLNLTTLFSVEQRETLSAQELIYLQVLHYIEIYGLNSPGLFNLEQKNGQVATIAYVQGLSRDELADKVRSLLYANAPIKDAEALKEIIESYAIDFDLNQVKNNEMRVLLFRLGQDVFQSGDDAVRYMCYTATESALLIKSKQVIKAIEADDKSFKADFFVDHERPLAKVFHRHKNLILAAKTSENAHAINRISRLAKTLHVPIHEPISKRFIAEAYADNVEPKVLQAMGVRDKFKFLNLLQYKMLGNTTDAFIIRNGKVHLEKERKVLNGPKLSSIVADVLDSLREDLAHLRKTTILLDSNVDYGLPISRKQVVGQLPFGTTVTSKGDTLSSGIYWENKWGATDLDLSAVKPGGQRTGWGQYSGYGANDIVFSGDLTHAEKGAMEFMTSKTTFMGVYALFVNIFNGQEGTKFALVVGSKTKAKWIEEPVLREMGTLDSKGNIVGFIKGGKFVVYSCRMNSNSWSVGNKEAAIVARGLADFWTISVLLNVLAIPYSLTRDPNQTYDHDLSYQGFSFDKLETMLAKG